VRRYRRITRAPPVRRCQPRPRRFGNPNDGRSGFYLLPNGSEALAARLLLSDRAEKTIDAQYYLVHDDVAGHLFASQLLKAADRGVRVRLLVDDMDTSGYDAMTSALDTHPNIEIRLFNPFWRQRGKALNAILDFRRINRRMHNKSMTFDNAVTIVGGRNIGTEYFEANENSNYYDLDVMGVGPIASEVSTSFDTYWNSPYAVPSRVVIQRDDARLSTVEARARMERLRAAALQTSYGSALVHRFGQGLAQGSLKLTWAPSRLVADPPEKAAGDLEGLPIVATVMQPYFDRAEKDLFVASAYFVPRKSGEARLAALEARGVDVTILTNSFDSNDVEPVYAHYARSRKPLLTSGVELWELRPNVDRIDRSLLGLGLSQSGLHTKAFIIDRKHFFVGSVNWDPRSVKINTEMGILIESPEMSTKAVKAFKRRLRDTAYEVKLDEHGDLYWLSKQENDTLLLQRSEPADSGLRLFKARILGVLPIGSQL
jgi:putative cardiolipin synthase